MIHLNEKCLFKSFLQVNKKSMRGLLLSFPIRTFTVKDLGTIKLEN